MVICVKRDTDLLMAQLMPLPLTASCFNEIQIGFTFLVPAHPGSPGKRAVKWVCVCNRVYLRTVTVLFFGPLCRWQQRCGLLLSVGLLQLLVVVTPIRKRSIVMRVFVCVCVCLRLSNLHQIFGYITYDRVSVLLWWHSDTLCTSGVV